MKEFIDKLISRLEELIEDSYYRCMDGSLSAGNENGAYHNVKDIINELAEEYKEKEYCWQKCCATEMCGECVRLCNGNIDYFEPLDSYFGEHNGGWIPCSERLPEVYGWYLATNNLGVVQQQYWGASHWQKLRDEAVIAWMPLPTPFAEGE